ncbi:hypothetical protein [Clostridium celatum]|uniref:hypothetical protein n=2 Tax=Clostridium celatum TaxID=36834 RepID=UPI00189AB2AB|nr:hypothetical protein [Clostridium celatum]MDY3359574.1 hypothetical protein [Clostridium celatum]
MEIITKNKVFNELDKNYRYLNNYMIAMEKALFRDANISITKAKMFSENLTQEVAKLEGLGLLIGMDQNDRLKELKIKTDIDEDGLAIFNKIRRVINMSSIDSRNNSESALLLHRCSYDLTCWFVNRYINKEFNMEEYIMPTVNIKS